MSNRKFSTQSLPYPNHFLELGTIDLSEKALKHPKWLPRFNSKGHAIEVVKSATCSVARAKGFVSDISARPYICINDARPELFLRRDFLKEFVDTGTLHIAPISFHPDDEMSYQLETANNVLKFTLNEKQYRRFGLIGKKIISTGKPLPSDRRLKEKFYLIEVDLKGVKIRKSDMRLDSLVRIFRRLNPIKQLYFRFESAHLLETEAIEKALAFFRCVIDEYAEDGFKPVPLTGCSIANQRIFRSWSNQSQLLPMAEIPQSLDDILLTSEYGKEGAQRNGDTLARLMCLIDWLGLQILSIDCNGHSDSNGKIDAIAAATGDNVDNDNDDDVVVVADVDHENSSICDVACVEFGGGSIDIEQISCFFGSNRSQDLILRALVLYSESGDKGRRMSPLSYQSSYNSSVFLLQNCSEASKSGLVTIIGVSW